MDEVVSILRDQSSQKLVLRMGKEIYRDPAELSDQKRSALEKVAVHWISWLRSTPEQLTEPLPRNEFILTPETESRLVQVTTSVEPTANEAQGVVSDNLKKTDVLNWKLQQEPQKLFSQPVKPDAFQESPKSGKDMEALKSKSIVAQIDDILQEMISKMQDAPKGVRLMEDIKGGVIVWVGAEKYLRN